MLEEVGGTGREGAGDHDDEDSDGALGDGRKCSRSGDRWLGSGIVWCFLKPMNETIFIVIAKLLDVEDENGCRYSMSNLKGLHSWSPDTDRGL